MTFHYDWLRENEAERCFDSWDSTGFHPERTDLPIDVQLLQVTTYAISTIMCDSLVGFFEAWIGDTAPEVVVTLERLGFGVVSSIIEEAMEIIGNAPYLRDQELRYPHVNPNFDKLRELSARIYEELPLNRFNDACDNFLRQVTSVHRIRDRPSQ